MTNGDFPDLDPDALARIEEALGRGRGFVIAARGEGNQLVQFADACAIGSDSELLYEARHKANSLLVESENSGLLLYFNVMTYECFVAQSGTLDFETLLSTLARRATGEFTGASIDLEIQKRAWRSRAWARTLLQQAAGDHVDATFWQDLRTQFLALDCPHLHAVPGNGWWHIDGLPTEPPARDALYSRFCFTVRRVLSAFGFEDSSVAVAVWLDLLRKTSSHYLNRCINNLCLASAECCSELKIRAVEGTVKRREDKTEHKRSASQLRRASPKCSQPRRQFSKAGDPSLLDGKQAVSFKVAEEYLGVGERQRQQLMKAGILELLGKGHARKITTASLRNYRAPENPK